MAAKTGRKPTARTRTRRKSAAAEAPVSRATAAQDDDDVFLSGGSKAGVAFGRCGGRVLSSQLEQTVCELLSRRGVAHSHTPRHFEVRVADDSVAAYAPMIVLRGRGREGKTVVIEGAESPQAPSLAKVRAFRGQYGVEFYVTFIASEDVLDEIPPDLYDEAVALSEAHTLANRLAD